MNDGEERNPFIPSGGCYVSVNKEVLNLIEAIRNSFDESVKIYTNGSCYHFYKILASVFPQAEPWYDGIYGHVLTNIDGCYYDINGVVNTAKEFYPLSLEPRLHEEAKTWKYRKSS